MASPALGDIEELTLCPRCRRPFDADRPPKLLACKHHFCLVCARSALGRGPEVYCAHCWKRTELPQGRADLLPTHAPLLALARRLADARACRACCGRTDLLQRLHALAARRRDALLCALDAAAALKLHLEADLAAPPPAPAADADLRAQLAEAALRCRLDDLVRAAAAPLDPDRVRRALAAPCLDLPAPASACLERRDPLLFLGNYCIAQVLSRGWSPEECPTEASASPPGASLCSPLLRAPGPYPLFFFDLEVNGSPFGRILIEVRNDVAPRMARNFAVLSSGELGVGYRGCSVFQCWEGESVITGDLELNNGRGGRSAFEEGWFMPDESRLPALRAAVGMRRSQRRHDNLGLVASQFRIVLREMRAFTGIFGTVVEGLDLVDRLSRTGDSAGKPQSSILISNCGKLN